MPPQIMGPQMNPNHVPRLVYNSSARSVGYWEDPLIRPNSFAGYVLPETVSHLLGDKDDLPFLTAFRAPEDELPVFDITRDQLQDLTDPHPTPGHQFKNYPVSGFDRAKDDLIYYFLVDDWPADESSGSV